MKTTAGVASQVCAGVFVDTVSKHIEETRKQPVSKFSVHGGSMDRSPAQQNRKWKFAAPWSLVLLLLAFVTLTGCGSGGYAGGGIQSLSRQSATIDAAQSISITATVSQGLGLTWTVSGAACTGSACGTVSNASGATITYTAPPVLTAPIQVQLIATVPGTSDSSTASITVNPAPTINGNPPTGTVGVAYTTTLTTSGGTGTLTLSMSGGALPAGLSFNPSTGVISGTPTNEGSSTATFSVTDKSDVPDTVTAQKTILIQTIATGALSISGAPPSGTVGTAYSSTLSASGGTAPYTWAIASGSLPPGILLGVASGILSGAPTTQGTYTFTAQAQDANGERGMATFTINVNAAGSTLSLTQGTLPNGTVGTPYSATIGVTGGTSPYSCTITSGTLPAGLTLGAACLVSGTPTTAGTTTVMVKATDSSNPMQSTSGSQTITINPTSLTLTMGTLPNGMVGAAYSATIGVAGGTSPYSCTLASGTLPAGLSLGANCLVSGTPTTPGTTTVNVKATDASSPMENTTGPETITITPASLALTTGTLPNGMVGAPYSATIGVMGGTSPYACSITGGTLPAGLSLGAGCLVSGTPTTAGTSTVTVKATDSGTPMQTTTGQETITITPAGLSLTTGTLPAGTVGTPYSSTIGVMGGTSPYSCAVTSGTLPAGLSLGAACLVSGTPTTAGTTTVMVKATDSSNPARSTTGPEAITINPAPSLVITSPPPATVNVPYMGTIPVTGGTGPYTCTIASGTLPAGLMLGPNCTITGKPTTSGSMTVMVKGTDSSQPPSSTTGPVTVTVNPSGTLMLSSPPAATVGTPYTGVIGVTGGTSPYSCSITSGTLPVGLTLGAACTITGTPTTAGTVSVMAMATDSGSPVLTTTGPVSITVNPIPPVTLTGSLPNATLGVPYTQTLHAAGGVGPYTYAVTAGSLPPGITLSSTGVISGTPTAVGASSFTVTATDSESTPQTASLPLVLLVVNPTTPNDAELNGPYAFLFQGYDDAVAGVLSYQTATAGSFTADGTGVISSGELDSNHQASTPTGTTVNTQGFLGTYTIGTDNRGSVTISTLNVDGTVGQTTTYAISVHAPVAPATTSASGSLIEFDNDQLAGTRGSGTFLAQQASAVTAGLAGSYVFGLSGDTPCLPACTIGIVAGPVASVGQFTTNGADAISSGESDANIASNNLANLALSGTYASPDANGRVQLAMTTSGTLNGVYPQDYAVYIVDASHAFIVSTDKHSAYILLAGSAQEQSTTAFTAASLSGPFVGYENSPTNPGLVGATLQNVLNLSTATIFRGTANGTGTCDTTNVDQAGLPGLLNGLTGLGSGSRVLNALLGTYASLGNSSCTLAANGRGVLNYPQPSTLLSGTLSLLGLGDSPPPPRVVYLAGQNQGYFLETGYAGLGNIEQQIGSPYTTATLDGTYVYGTSPAASAASLNASGIFTADGAGHASTTLDENVGVGTINLLQLGDTGSFNYTLTDAAAGRFLLAPSTVIYAITPNRFVLVDENQTTTSPSIALIY
jgi:hypothetical protein